MAIGEGEAAGSIMIRSGYVLPVILFGVVDKVTIVDRVRVLIEHQPGPGRSGNLGLFEELSIVEPPILASYRWISRRRACVAAKKGVHRETAIASGKFSFDLLRAEENVSRTFVGTD